MSPKVCGGYEDAARAHGRFLARVLFMDTESEDPADDKLTRLERLKQQYLEARQADRRVLQSTLVEQNPDLKDELLSFFRTDDWLRSQQQPQPAFAATGFDPWTDPSVVLPGGTRVRYFGDYEVIELLGKGGMGAVYRVRQISLERDVALKIVGEGSFASDEALRRFQTEAEAVAALDHPNIVPIFEVGEHLGLHYYAMKLVPAGSLKSCLTRFTDHPRSSASLVSQAANAVHHAHLRGILHRDLKPANILLDDQGKPHVADFGLAKRVGDQSERTAHGEILGTPAYMAPEQAAGHNASVTVATDVYGLGAILYALLTGRAPFVPEGPKAILDQVREDRPVPPVELNPKTPRALSVICLKCLEKDPQLRYKSAEALASDLDNWLAGRPISAQPVGRVRRGWMWCKRNPVVASLVLALAAIVLAAASVAMFFARAAGIKEGNTRAALMILHQRIISHTTQGRLIEAEADAREALGLLQDSNSAIRQDFQSEVDDALTRASLLKVRYPISAADWAIRNRRAMVSELYESTFKNYGINTGDVARAVDRVRSSKIQADLLVALEDWSTTTHDHALRDRLRGIADRADPHPESPSSQIRRALRDRKVEPSLLTKLAKDVQVRALPPQLLVELALALRRSHRDAEAIDLLRDASRRHRGDFWIAVQLGAELYRTAQTPMQEAEADEVLAVALALSMGSPFVYMYPGILTYDSGMQPGSGLSQRDRHLLARSVAAYRKAIEVAPDFAPAYCNLGNSLTALGKHAESEAALRKSIELDGTYALAYYNLGVVLDAERKTAAAVESYRSAVKYDPTYPEAYANLAADEYLDGEFAAAATSFLKWLEHSASTDPLRATMTGYAELSTSLAQVAPLLKPIRDGTTQPETPAQALALARLFAHPKFQDRVLAAELYHKAFEQDPALAKDTIFGDRYAAAESAAIAASDRNTAEPKRAGFRRWALEWLDQELVIREKEIRASSSQTRADARQKLAYWLSDIAFSSFREVEPLKQIPAAERESWSKLWSRVRIALSSNAQ
jgi:serine/threonine-protein kinase